MQMDNHSRELEDGIMPCVKKAFQPELTLYAVHMSFLVAISEAAILSE